MNGVPAIVTPDYSFTSPINMSSQPTSFPSPSNLDLVSLIGHTAYANRPSRGPFAFLDFLLPGFVLEHTDALMFPMPWHIRLNRFWLLQSLLALLWCWRSRRFFPQRGGSWTAWPARQFAFLLVVHGLFYVIELYTTKMWTGFTAMAIHHSVALLIFATVAREPNSLCVVTLAPFAWHALYWSLGAESDLLLYSYNWLLFLCGAAGMHNIFVERRATDRPISPVLPLAVLTVCFTNYFTYCHDYRGSFCWRPSPPDRPGLAAGPVERVLAALGKRRARLLAYTALPVILFVVSLVAVWYVAVRVSRPILERWRRARAGMASGGGKGDLEALAAADGGYHPHPLAPEARAKKEDLPTGSVGVGGAWEWVQAPRAVLAAARARVWAAMGGVFGGGAWSTRKATGKGDDEDGEMLYHGHHGEEGWEESEDDQRGRTRGRGGRRMAVEGAAAVKLLAPPSPTSSLGTASAQGSPDAMARGRRL
ncbi:hypothetical protein HDU96_000153 [Phlyctochytrium bullatum]|nr:hypothetical protein HDU96_000153 [Phlyctochytrium bullatum]